MPSIPRRAFADEAIDIIITSPTIETRITGTLIDVGKAASIVIPGRALATEPIHLVNADTTVGTRL